MATGCTCGGPGESEARVFTLGNQRDWWWNGLEPGQSYRLQIEAYDEEKDLSAFSAEITATPQDAPFELSGPASLGTIRRQPVEAEMTLKTDLKSYPELVMLRAAEVPNGVEVGIDNPAPTACGADGVPDSGQFFCPTQEGVAATVMLSLTNSLVSGEYPVTFEALGGGITETLTLALQVQGVDFTLEPSVGTLAVPMATVGMNLPESLQPTIDVTLVGNNDEQDPATLSVDGLPEGVEVSFWKDGTEQTTPTLVAGEAMQLKLRSIIPAPTSDEEATEWKGSLTLVGQSIHYFEEEHAYHAHRLQPRTNHPTCCACNRGRAGQGECGRGGRYDRQCEYAFPMVWWGDYAHGGHKQFASRGVGDLPA